MIKLIVVGIFLFSPQTVFAQAVDLKDHYAYGNLGSLSQGLGYLIMPMFALASLAVTIYLILGAFKFLSSGGDKEGIAAGKNMITHALIAFLMLIMLFLVLEYLLEAIGLQGFNLIGS